MKFYFYPNCSTCKKAKTFLETNHVSHEAINIAENPPTIKELELMLEGVGNIRKLFNTSGQVYRQLNLKDKLPTLSNGEAIAMLADNGMLIKRPFLLGNDVALVGYKEEVWREHLK